MEFLRMVFAQLQILTKLSHNLSENLASTAWLLRPWKSIRIIYLIVNHKSQQCIADKNTVQNSRNSENRLHNFHGRKHCMLRLNMPAKCYNAPKTSTYISTRSVLCLMILFCLACHGDRWTLARFGMFRFVNKYDTSYAQTHVCIINCLLK